MHPTLSVFGLLMGGVANVAAHMQLNYPPPLRAANNPHTQGTPDNELLFPYNCCGKITPMPCRGYLSLLGTPEGASVATWTTGSQQTWSMAGPAPLGGNHYGGSCQIGFSTDQGQTFRTTVSYEGNCPHRNGGEDASSQEFPFTVPSDLPTGDVIFAWTWVNREQEFFMNCAVVNIEDRSGSTTVSSPPTNGSSAAVSATSSSPAVKEYDSPTESAAPTSSDDSTAPTDCDCDSCSNSHSCRAYCRSQKNQPRSIPALDVSMKHKRVPGGHAQRLVQRASTMPFSQRPAMLFANIDNGCTTPKTDFEAKYPNPGPDVVEGDGEYPLQLPEGTCG